MNYRIFRLNYCVLFVLIAMFCNRLVHAQEAEWFEVQPRTFLVDFQFPDPEDQGVEGTPSFLENMDPVRIVKQVKKANANTIIVHSKCMRGNAYYNTEFGHKHSNIGERDLMKEFSVAARAEGLNLLFYHVMSQDRRYWDEHPEGRAEIAPGRDHKWVLLNDDRLVTKDEMIVSCLNGPHRDYLKDMTAELARNYDFDGFWLDWGSLWPLVSPCYCSYCTKEYVDSTGKELPTTSEEFVWPKGNDYGVFGRYSTAVRNDSWEEYAKYYKWRVALNTKIIEDIVNNIKSINPNLTVTTNGSATSMNQDWDYPESLDYLCNEYHFNAGMAATSFKSLQQKALKPGAPFEIESWRFCTQIGGGGRGFLVKTPAALITEMAPVIAHGGFSQYYDQLRADGTLDEESLDIAEQAFAEVASKQPWARIGKPITYASILWSKSTDAFGIPQGTGGHGEGIKGFHNALMESHVPVEIISEQNLKNILNGDTKVLIVPSAQVLSENTVEVLKEFVNQGGGLVVTGLSSVNFPPNKEVDNPETNEFLLTELIGADFKDISDHIFDFVNLRNGHPVTAGLSYDIPLTTEDYQAVTVTPHDGTQVLGTLVKDTPGFFMGSLPGKDTKEPVITVNNVGKGRVVYLGLPVGALYNRFAHHYHKQLLKNSVMWAANADMPVTAETYETVEIVPWHEEDSKRTVVHVINRTGAGLPHGEGVQQHELIPVHDVKLKINKEYAGTKAFSQPGNKPLPVEFDAGGSMTVNLDKVEVWEVVEIVQ